MILLTISTALCFISVGECEPTPAPTPVVQVSSVTQTAPIAVTYTSEELQARADEEAAMQHCYEDEPCWDCNTDGNGICGPTAPAPTLSETTLSAAGAETVCDTEPSLCPDHDPQPRRDPAEDHAEESSTN